MDAAIYYLNGEVSVGECPKVLAEDRAHVFGDGIYEVIGFYGGRPLALDRHLKRLRRSAEALEIDLDALRGQTIPPEISAKDGQDDSLSALGTICTELVRRHGLKDASVYLQVSRGYAPRSHAIGAGMSPSLFMFARAKTDKMPQRLERGVKAITWVDTRWLRCDIKSLNLLPNAVAKTKAVESEADEAIFYRVIDPVSGGFSTVPVMTSSWGEIGARSTIVTEGSSTNLFIVLDGAILTHPADNLILPGITRDLIVEICSNQGMRIEEKKFGLKELFNAEEAFLTGTGTEVAPVTSIDGMPVGSGRPGETALRIAAAFSEMVKEECEVKES